MVIQERLADLKFSNLESLEAASELPANNQLKNLTSLRAFSHVERLFDEAELKRKHGDEEQAYILYSRTCGIARLITEKRDFLQFKATPGGRHLYSIFKDGLSKLHELQESLTKRYELKEVERKYIEKAKETVATNSSDVNEAVVKSVPEIGFTILPRDLVRAIESKKKILMIDYRSKRSSLVKYDCPGRVFVARVPTSAIVPGCISSTLIRSAEISERAALQRMSDVDLVVLIGSKNPVVGQDGLQIGSVDQILFDALLTYNNNFRLRRPPIFLDGGFSNWALHYPMHIKSDPGENVFDFDDQNDFTRAAAEYRKAILDVQALEYPDLLHRSTKVTPKPSFPTIPQNGVNSYNASSTTTASSMASSVSDVSEKPFASATRKPQATDANFSRKETSSDSNTDLLKPDIIEKHEKLPKSASENKAGAEIISRMETDMESDENALNTKFVKGDAFPVIPSIDRSKKPQGLPKDPVIPTFDRSNKPKLVVKRNDDAKINETAFTEPEIKRSLSPYFGQNGLQPKARGGARLDTALQPTVPTIPDRSKKPYFGPSTSDRLMDLYELALSEIDAKAVKNATYPGYTGFRNLRNTCYMNATLQALCNTLPMRKIFGSSYFLKFVNRENSKGTLGVCSAAFSALMNAVWSCNYSVINPSFFRSVFVSQVNRDFADFEQHDAQEFQIFLLAALHEDMDQVKKPVTFQQDYTGKDLRKEALDFENKWKLYTNSPINDIFRCVTLTVKKCGTCGQESVSFEEITQLSIAISKPSLFENICAHFDEITLEGDSKWKCTRCKVHRVSSLKTNIWKAPEILVAHLKRSTDGINKNDVMVSFDTDCLSIRDCIHPLASYNSCLYSIYAVINHVGSLNSGHYTAFVQNVQEDGTTQWLFCDDDVLKPVSEDAICTKNAVVLYFRKVTR